MSNTAMIMCAGLGTRLKPFTVGTAKPFLPVMGTPVVEYTVHALIDSQINKLITNIHHKPIESRLALQKIEENKKIKILISDESQRLMGSAGGIRKIIDQVYENSFFITNGDNLFHLNWNKLRERHNHLRKKKNILMTLVLKKNTTQQSYRELFFDDASGLLLSLGQSTLGKFYYTGTCLAEKEAFAHLRADEPTDFVQDVLQLHIKNEKVAVFVCDDHWIDIGRPSLLAEADYCFMDLIETKTMPHLWREIVLSRNTRKKRGVWFENSIQISPKTSFNPNVYLSGPIEGFDEIGPQVVGYGPVPQKLGKKIENCIFYQSNFKNF